MPDSRCFCTVVTASFLPYARALRDSYARFCDLPLKVLVVDSDSLEDDSLNILTLTDLTELPVTRDIRAKYAGDLDRVRWCMKPVLLEFLLSKAGYDAAIFIDPDLCFFEDPSFLFDELEACNILLSPHWRSSDPQADPVNFERNFRDGIYNGGMVGASKGGLEALQWWSNACLYKCEQDPSVGLFDDQKYLDILHSRFRGVEPIRHHGCNVAAWNMVDCRRVDVDGRVLINGTEPVVFMHMTKSTMRGIARGADALLAPHLREYQALLNAHRSEPVDFFTELSVPAKPEKPHLARRALRKIKRLVS